MPRLAACGGLADAFGPFGGSRSGGLAMWLLCGHTDTNSWIIDELGEKGAGID